MSDFKTGRRKNLDLVLARPGGEPTGRTFQDLAVQFGIRLDPDEAVELAGLPLMTEAPVGSVLLALEAKACMTAHSKSRPRLYDELNSSHLTIHGANDHAIAAGFVTINVSDTFISPDMNKRDLAVNQPVINLHNQPKAAESVFEKIRELPRRIRPGEEGYDAIGVVMLDLVNDGRPVEIVEEPPAPDPGSPYSYEMMISRITHAYDTQFGHI